MTSSKDQRRLLPHLSCGCRASGELNIVWLPGDKLKCRCGRVWKASFVETNTPKFVEGDRVRVAGIVDSIFTETDGTVGYRIKILSGKRKWQLIANDNDLREFAAPKEPRFKTGDYVRHRSTGKWGVIEDVNKAIPSSDSIYNVRHPSGVVVGYAEDELQTSEEGS